jgi:hypothetical protein
MAAANSAANKSGFGEMTLKFAFAAVLFLGSIAQCAAGESLLVRPDAPGRYPLALINHGSPRSAADRPNMTPFSMLPEAVEFARRGWAAVVMMRRGYGGSGGGWAEDYGACNNPNYLAAAASAAADLKTATA